MELTASGEQLRRRIKSLHPLLLLVTHEEQRGVGLIVSVVRDRCPDFSKVMVWTFGIGWVDVWNRTNTKLNETAIPELNPNKSFEVMRAPRNRENGGTIYVLKDFTQFINGPAGYVTTRMLRDTVAQLRDIDEKEGPGVIIMLDSETDIPNRLEKLVHVIDLELPDRAHLENEFRYLVESRIRENNMANLTGQPDPDGRHTLNALVEASLGLTLTEAESALAMSFVACDGVDPQIIINEKKGIIKKSGVLEYFETNTGLDDVGGLQNLKAWLELRKQAFSPEAREFGLPSPRGLLAVGPPGVGKSLTAKAIGKSWGMPVVKMDVGALFGSLVGASEANMRKALKVAAAVSPCILWVN